MERDRAFGGVWGRRFRYVAPAILTMVLLLPSTLGLASAATDKPVVTFAGLRIAKDGSASLSVDLTRGATVESVETGQRVRLFLRGATIRLKNNENPLLAEYFCANVIRAKLDLQKDGVMVTIDLRQPSPVSHQMSPVEHGATFTVDVPKPAQVPAHCVSR